MKKIKILILVLLISSGFLSKTVVADTTDVYFNNIEQWYDTTIFCSFDTIRMHESTGATPLGFVSPDDVLCETHTLLLIGDSVYYFDWTENTDTVRHVNKNGIWSSLCVPGYNQHATFFFTTPVTEPWAEEERAICGESDTLYAGNSSYQDGVYFIWEEIGVGVISEGYYPNDTSLILDHTADIQLSIIDGCNTIVDTISMTVVTNILPDLGPDYTVCDPVVNRTLSLTETYDTYLWSDGSTGPTLDITQPDTFWVDVSNVCISDRDSIIVNQVNSPWLWLGYDKEICDGTSTILDMGFDYDVLVWSRITETDTIWINSNERYLEINSDDHLMAFAAMNGCESMTDDVIVTLVHPYAESEICIATVDTSGHNKIVWNRTFDAGIASYNIYRLVDDYTIIGNVAIEEDPIFYDTEVDPMVSANRYKISAVDTCGNESDLSWYHGTIHITSSNATSGGIDLTITDQYIEESGNYSPEKIYIFIDSLDNGNLTVIDSINAAFHSYHVNEPYPGATYVAGIGLPWNCAGVKSFDKTLGSKLIGNIALSNKSAMFVGTQNIQKRNISIYPNPSSGIFHIEGMGIEKIEVFNITGQLILSTNNLSIDLSNQTKGVYFAKITNTYGPVIEKIILN